ncbi:MAG: ATPase domain-containing protein [Polyangiales bacterium]
MSEVVSLDDRGLDLVLGGGLRRVRRVDDKHATVLLVRGPAGSGKTLVGFHAALALQKHFGGPIAYACVELLPTEFEAQVRAWRTDLNHLNIRHRESRGEVSPDAGGVVEASLIDLTEGPEALGAQVERFVERLTNAGAAPGVLVIDSLIEGYRIGSSAPREFVDSVCKLATKWGLALVLLEECASGTTSPWVFAVDTVLELGLATEDGDASRASPLERRLTVLKHRFGPSDAGPHGFTLEPGAPLRVFPRPSAWLEPWTVTLPEGVGVPREPSRNDGDRKLLIPTSNQGEKWVGLVVAVFGHVPDKLISLGLKIPRQDHVDKTALLVSFTLPLGERFSDGDSARLGVAHPYLSAHRFLRVVLDELNGRPDVRRIVLTDLRALRSYWNADGLRRAVGVLCQLARRMGMPVVLIHSTPNRMERKDTAPHGFLVSEAPGQEVAWAADFADLAVEVLYGATASSPIGRVTDLETGRVGDITFPSPPR